MKKSEYFALFDSILTKKFTEDPYTDIAYFEYVKLNHSRMNRWLKKGILDDELVSKVKQIRENQNWIIITEPWCGDAAHIVPFIIKLAEENPFINLEIQLRDSGSEIENYLTNGGKSIPIFIIRNKDGKDLNVWGPRPKACQELFIDLKSKNLSSEEQKSALQNWYNQDKGQSFQSEWKQLFIELKK